MHGWLDCGVMWDKAAILEQWNLLLCIKDEVLAWVLDKGEGGASV